MRDKRCKRIDSGEGGDDANYGNEVAKGKLIWAGFGHMLMVLVENVFFYGSWSKDRILDVL